MIKRRGQESFQGLRIPFSVYKYESVQLEGLPGLPGFCHITPHAQVPFCTESLRTKSKVPGCRPGASLGCQTPAGLPTDLPLRGTACLKTDPSNILLAPSSHPFWNPCCSMVAEFDRDSKPRRCFWLGRANFRHPRAHSRFVARRTM